MKGLLSVLVLGSLVVGTQALAFGNATTFDYRPEVARLTRSLEMGGTIQEVQRALDSLLSTAIAHLRARGKNKEADDIALEWQQYRPQLARRNLGDHDPLFPWLRRTYQVLEILLGSRTMKQYRLTDLNTLNFALPVVLNPEGKGWDRTEYRKHFVPLAGITTYWSTFLGCRAVIEWSLLQRVCGPAASAAGWLMETTIAPTLSDKVYGHFAKGF